MENKQRSMKAWVFSTVGVLGMAVVLIAINIIGGTISFRGDMTEEKLYTLSRGTRRILAKMDTPVTIRFYYSKDAAQMPVFLKSYAQRVQDLLKEYREAAGGHIAIQRFNPTPDSDAEDSANLDGIYGQSMGVTGDQVYLGLAISCLDQTVAIPALSPEREDLLEYDISRAIYRVLHPEKTVLGVMSSLPVMGHQVNPMMRMQGMQQPDEPPWLFVSELKRDFDVREVHTDVDSIDRDIDVLMLVHPTNLSDKTYFAIDQFVLRGGRLLAFLDPMSMVEAQQKSMPQMPHMPPGSSTLGPLLNAWGLRFETEKVIADLQYMTRVQGRDGQPQSMPTVLSLQRSGKQGDVSPLDPDDPATSQLHSLLFAFGGVFSGDGAPGLDKSVLIYTSEDSQLVEKFMAQMPGDSIMKDFRPEGRRQALAVRLSGNFRTAFPEGSPDRHDGDDDDPAKDDAQGPFLKESSRESVVVLLGDSDMLYDHFCVQKHSFFGQQVVSPMNDNLNLVQNLVEQLSGDNNLISIRSRGRMARPFVIVQRMRAEAEQKYKDRIKALEDELSELQTKISGLRREQGQDQRFILSDEQKQAIDNFRQRQAETRRELKDVRRRFRRDIDGLERRLKWANIALMPVLVTMGGISLAIVKRRRMVRK